MENPIVLAIYVTLKIKQHVIKKQQNSTDDNNNNNQISIEFDVFHDFIAQKFENTTNNNELLNNNPEFNISCTLNLATLKGNFKEKAGHIIEIISEVDEFTWV